MYSIVVSDWWHGTARVTPLATACWEGRTDIVRLLLYNGNGIDINNTWTPLYYACREGHTDIVSLLYTIL